MPEYRVDFRSPYQYGKGIRYRKVFTFTLADNEEEAKRNVLKHHPGSINLTVTLKDKGTRHGHH